MTKKILTISMFVGLVFVLAGCGVTVTETTTDESDSMLTQEIVDLVGDSVVSVECYTSETEEYFFGSGVVWNDNGDIITNNHIIPQNDENITADYCLLVDGNVTSAITLPASGAGIAIGQKFIIKDSAGTSNVNNITINRQGADVIDGAVSFVINTIYDSITIIYGEATKYYII